MMTHYPNDHIIVAGYTEYWNRLRAVWYDMSSDDRSNRKVRWEITSNGCPKNECLSMATSELRGITVVDKGTYEEVWLVQK